MTTLPAVVRIIDLPVYTTVTGGELFEAIQTVGGTTISVQIPATAIVTTTFGALPTGGGTGQVLGKSSNSNFSTAWYDITTFILANATTLATSGSGTALVLNIASGGVGSTQLATNALQRGNVTARAIGSAQIDTSAIVRANITALAIGSAQLDVGSVIGTTSIVTASIGTAQMVTGAIGITLLNTLSPNGIASVSDTTSFSANYRAYMITIDQVVPATGTTYLRMQIATSGSNWITAGYLAVISAIPGIGAETDATSFLLSGKTATTSVSSNGNHGVWGSLYFFNAGSSAKGISGAVSYLAAGGILQAVASPGGSSGQITTATGVNFLFSAGNIATGTIKIYGMY